MEHAQGGSKVGVGVVLFIVGFIALVGAAFLITNMENNEIKKFNEKLSDISGRVESLDKTIAKLAVEQSGRCEGIEGQIISLQSQADRIEKISNQPAKVSVTFPHVVPVSIVERRQQGQGKQIIFGSSGNIPVTTDARTDKRGPLLKRAGVPHKEEGQ